MEIVLKKQLNLITQIEIGFEYKINRLSKNEIVS